MLIVVSLCCSASSVVDVVSVVVVAVAVVAAFLQPFRGAVSFCLSTFLMPQKKSNSLTPRLPHATHKLATSLLSLSLTLSESPPSLRHLATHCDTLAVKLITLLAIPAQLPVDCSALD